MNRAPAPVPAIEVEFPDLAPWEAGNTGLPFVWCFAAGRPGPRVTITMPGRPVSRAVASAIIAAPASCRQTVTSIFAS